MFPLLFALQDAAEDLMGISEDFNEVMQNIPLISGTTKAVLQAYATYPMIGVLIVLMLLDITSGIVAAIVTKTLNSNTSWNGMCRKALILIIVGVAAVLDPYAQGLPIAKLVALFYIITEALSILENAARARVPVPKSLMDVLSKLRTEERASIPIHVNKVEVTASVDAHKELHEALTKAKEDHK